MSFRLELLYNQGHLDGSAYVDIRLAEVIVPTSQNQGHQPSSEFTLYLMLISTIGLEKNFLAQKK